MLLKIQFHFYSISILLCINFLFCFTTKHLILSLLSQQPSIKKIDLRNIHTRKFQWKNTILFRKHCNANVGILLLMQLCWLIRHWQIHLAGTDILYYANIELIRGWITKCSWASFIPLKPSKTTYHLHFFSYPWFQKPGRNHFPKKSCWVIKDIGILDSQKCPILNHSARFEERGTIPFRLLKDW